MDHGLFKAVTAYCYHCNEHMNLFLSKVEPLSFNSMPNNRSLTSVRCWRGKYVFREFSNSGSFSKLYPYHVKINPVTWDKLACLVSF